jgi:3-isopropylmalate/(R)-2-methylmalate dehydratase large subunit
MRRIEAHRVNLAAVARVFQIALGEVVDVGALAGQPIQVALIGTCTNGRLDDIRQAAQMVKGRRIARGVRMVVTPASRSIYLAAMREGLIEILTEAGASVDPAGCGTCVGITHKLMAADREWVISSANRNFKGRLGNPESDILIASSATVAASALTGRVTDPREFALDIRAAA